MWYTKRNECFFGGLTMTNTERHALFLGCFPFYRDLSAGAQAELCERAVSASIEGGVAVCGLRGRCVGVLVVTRGRARAFIRSAEGREITLCRLSAGDIFVMPRSGLFGTGEVDMTLEAEVPMTAEVLDPATVSWLCEGAPLIENFFLKNAIAWYGTALRATRAMLLEGLDARLASFLLGEVARHGGDTVYLTQEEIAHHIGSAREAVSRMLKQFAAAGLITVLRGGVKLRDAQALRGLVINRGL